MIRETTREIFSSTARPQQDFNNLSQAAMIELVGMPGVFLWSLDAPGCAVTMPWSMISLSSWIISSILFYIETWLV